MSLQFTTVLDFFDVLNSSTISIFAHRRKLIKILSPACLNIGGQ